LGCGADASQASGEVLGIVGKFQRGFLGEDAGFEKLGE
jgi:hypothetical protein